jgi:hypothetical protein
VGTTLGGIAVIITGTMAVTIGGSAATGLTVVNSTIVTATKWAGSAGTESVLARTLGGANPRWRNTAGAENDRSAVLVFPWLGPQIPSHAQITGSVVRGNSTKDEGLSPR